MLTSWLRCVICVWCIAVRPMFKEDRSWTVRASANKEAHRGNLRISLSVIRTPFYITSPSSWFSLFDHFRSVSCLDVLCLHQAAQSSPSSVGFPASIRRAPQCTLCNRPIATHTWRSHGESKVTIRSPSLLSEFQIICFRRISRVSCFFLVLWNFCEHSHHLKRNPSLVSPLRLYAIFLKICMTNLFDIRTKHDLRIISAISLKGQLNELSYLRIRLANIHLLCPCSGFHCIVCLLTSIHDSYDPYDLHGLVPNVAFPTHVSLLFDMFPCSSCISCLAVYTT